MKHFILMFVALMFLANTVAVSAWAKPCMNAGSAKIMQEMNASMDADMPCHDEESQNNNEIKHCEGVCLCLHASTAQTPITGDVAVLLHPDISGQQIMISQDDMASRSTSPPRRPPKLNS